MSAAIRYANSTPETPEGSFRIHLGSLHLFAPTALNDLAGEDLYEAISEAMEQGLGAVAASIAEKFPQVTAITVES